MPDKPFVSVVIATRNRFDLLRQALESIAAQEYQDYEAIVVDDGSDQAVQERYDVLFRQLPGNFTLHRARAAGSSGTGPGAARNVGIRLARGEYVAFLDDDDRWSRTDHLAVAGASLENRQADFFFSDIQGLRNGKVVAETWFPNLPQLTSGRVVHVPGEVHELSFRTIRLVAMRQGAHPDGWVARRSMLEALGGFWEMGHPSEDYELFARILDRAKGVLYRPVPTVSYRLPEGDAVSLKFTRLEEHLQIVRNALHLRATCKSRWALRCARAQESWHLRQIALLMLEGGRLPAATSFACQAVFTYPTLGALALATRTVLKSLTRAVHAERLL